LDYKVSAITKRILLGPFLSPDRAAFLRSVGVTHVLNVSEAPSVVRAEVDGFDVIHDCPLTDFVLIPDDVAITCIETLHKMLIPSESKVYVHCIAGQNRSATIVWLYLIARGLTRAAAKTLVERAAIDAVPGHKTLVDDRLASLIESYGRGSLLPLSAATDLEPP
jgi:protein-tyrosine phosphatase